MIDSDRNSSIRKFTTVIKSARTNSASTRVISAVSPDQIIEQAKTASIIKAARMHVSLRILRIGIF